MIEFRGRGILLDIEGTVAPIRFVYDVLFPFARQRAAAFLAARWDEPPVRAVRARIASDAGIGELGHADLVAHVQELMEQDAKATGLKELQGLIWAEGYAAGELCSMLFADVPPALRGWRERGLDLRIYSSGSAGAQRVFFAHTQAGDLTPLFSGFYDTTVGKKQESASYAALVRAFALSAAEILFASDVPAELDAAATAGMQTVLLLRPENKPVDAGRHACVTSFDEIRIGV